MDWTILAGMFCSLMLATVAADIGLYPKYATRQHYRNCLKCKRYTNAVEYLILKNLGTQLQKQASASAFCSFLGQTSGPGTLCGRIANDVFPNVLNHLRTEMSAPKACSLEMKCEIYKILDPANFNDFDDYVELRDVIQIFHNGVQFTNQNFSCAVCVPVMQEVKKLLKDQKLQTCISDAIQGICLTLQHPNWISTCQSTAAKYVPWLMNKISDNLDTSSICKDLFSCSNDEIKPGTNQCPHCHFAIEHAKPTILRGMPGLLETFCKILNVYDVKGYSTNDCIQSIYELRERIGGKIISELSADAICRDLNYCNDSDTIQTNTKFIHWSNEFPKVEIIEDYEDACGYLMDFVHQQLLTSKLQWSTTAVFDDTCKFNLTNANDTTQCREWAQSTGRILTNLADKVDAEKICDDGLQLDSLNVPLEILDDILSVPAWFKTDAWAIVREVYGNVQPNGDVDVTWKVIKDMAKVPFNTWRDLKDLIRHGL